MKRRTLQLAVVAAFAAILVVGVGAAVAGGGLGASREAFLNDVAKRLDVTPAQLEAALEGAYGSQVDAAVEDGKITKEQGEAMKKRAAEGGVPFFGGGHRGGPGGGLGHAGAGGLDAAASYLGLTEAELHAQLESGKSLAEVAKAEGKSVAGLKQAMTAAAEKKLDAAVEAGRITQEQADAMLERITDSLDEVIAGTFGSGMHPGGRGFGPLGGGHPGRGHWDGDDEQGGGTRGSGSFGNVPA